jgi:hypothetical protein
MDLTQYMKTSSLPIKTLDQDDDITKTLQDYLEQSLFHGCMVQECYGVEIELIYQQYSISEVYSNQPSV